MTTPTRTALRIPQVTAKTGLSRSTLYRLIQSGEFPKPYRLSQRISVWDEQAIDEYLAKKLAGVAQ